MDINNLLEQAWQVSLTVPSMRIENHVIDPLRWSIKIPDFGYSTEARGAEQLLRKVREAKSFCEDWQKAKKKSKKKQNATKNPCAQVAPIVM